jgi:hypothetical protein
MKLFLFLLAIALSSFAVAQLPDAPEARPAHVKRLIASNLIMYGATVFGGYGRRTEVRACVGEMGLRNGVYGAGDYAGRTPASQRKFYAIALPIDSAVTAFSLFAHKKNWHGLEIAAPLSTASAHFALGGMKYADGCY